MKDIAFTLKIKYCIEVSFVWALVKTLSFFPRKISLILGKNLGRILYLILPSRFEIAKQNLIASFPGIPEKKVKTIIKQCWENLGEGAADFVKMAEISKEDFYSFVEAQGLTHLKNSYSQGKGALILTAHYGAWEWGAKFWPFSGFKTAVIARRVKNPYVNDLVTKIRSADGVKVILSRNGVREGIRWLKEGNLLAILIDHRVKEGGLQIPFFGRLASTTSLPAILSLRYAIPVHLVRSWKEKSKIKIHISPAMDFSDLSQSEADIFEATCRMNKVVEDWIREQPQRWLWIHNRWKT
ncbi:MAG: hypothetical protein A3I11_04850 [Elusimicrobia bacterium RIFCSPLOWO2_02_FULL_39_32]|nr:MAG: hypothetical protein A3B80_00755 [Elusimicrobia bacterium RIFCSPHIGHO2_02_FULL_39_36]OGR91087.1 MAG: hypothetical protein A3I11_04850 [Elusimicrobia bacterium RIFCSPLOWO2_02_FULL_39_32]OGS00054.1 MAG: hypothetical protein A3G85_07815 [Elusimicrobia bacterium RIFCSPLOWO2_12_FULL_39_28]